MGGGMRQRDGDISQEKWEEDRRKGGEGDREVGKASGEKQKDRSEAKRSRVRGRHKGMKEDSQTGEPRVRGERQR